MATSFKNRTVEVHRTFEPGTTTWSFIAGMGSVLHLVPGVVNPVYDTVYYTSDWTTPESVDGIMIQNYWEWVGADLAAAIEETAKVA